MNNKVYSCQAKIYAHPEHFQNVLINYEFEWEAHRTVNVTWLKIMQRIRLTPSDLITDLESSIFQDFQKYTGNEGITVRLNCEVEQAFTNVRAAS